MLFRRTRGSWEQWWAVLAARPRIEGRFDLERGLRRGAVNVDADFPATLGSVEYVGVLLG